MTATMPRELPEPVLVQTARWLVRPIAFMESARRRYGDAFAVTFLGFRSPMVLVSDPEVVRALYSERANGLPPGRSIALLPLLGPRSVLLLEGEEHLARRKLMLPPFHGERMRAYEEVVREIAAADIARWPRGETFALHPRMQAITLDVILRAVFGVTDPERGQALKALLPKLLEGTGSLLLQARVMAAARTGRGDPLADLRATGERIDALLMEEIEARRAAPGDDILSMLVQARFEDGSAMGDRELRDQLMTLLLAGHETTATALAWTMDLLLRHPWALARLREEVAGSEGDAYLRAVVQESLRLRPVVPIAGRRLAQDLDAGGLHLPAGTDVTPAIWLTHTRADLYPEPYAFRPERFLERAPTTYGWIPFGGGVRRCLGAAFAEMEMRVVLTEIVRSAALQPASAQAERVTRRNITFSPRAGTRVRLAAASAGRST